MATLILKPLCIATIHVRPYQRSWLVRPCPNIPLLALSSHPWPFRPPLSIPHLFVRLNPPVTSEVVSCLVRLVLRQPQSTSEAVIRRWLGQLRSSVALVSHDKPLAAATRLWTTGGHGMQCHATPRLLLGPLSSALLQPRLASSIVNNSAPMVTATCYVAHLIHCFACPL